MEEATLSHWMRHGKISPRAPLPHDLNADVCVIGAGIAGLSTAFNLARRNLNVVVLEAAEIAEGQTGRTTAHLSNALDDRFFELERYHGREGARLAAESHGAAIDWIEAFVREHNVPCGFERLPGYLFLGPQEDWAYLEKEAAAAQRAGHRDVRLLRNGPAQLGPCLEFPQQAQFDVIPYLRSLAQVFESLGGQIYTQTAVDRIDGTEVHTRRGFTVRADSVVVATNAPVNDLVVMHTKQAPYRTYAVSARFPKNALPKALFWDTSDPYHYVRLDSRDPSFDYLIVGGEDHKTGQERHPETHFENLESWARNHFPLMQGIESRWSGQVLEPVDGLGYIGKNPLDNDRVFIVTGDSGHGITHGTIAGLLLCDLVCNEKNAWSEIYTPSRKTFSAVGNFVSENVNVVGQYGDWFRGGDVGSVDEIPLDSGAILRNGIVPEAVYRDALGTLHRCSAVCTHLEGVVRWNSVEKTWDCPCHGSRFSRFGRVIEGPAIQDLRALETEEGADRGPRRDERHTEPSATDGP